MSCHAGSPLRARHGVRAPSSRSPGSPRATEAPPPQAVTPPAPQSWPPTTPAPASPTRRYSSLSLCLSLLTLLPLLFSPLSLTPISPKCRVQHRELVILWHEYHTQSQQNTQGNTVEPVSRMASLFFVLLYSPPTLSINILVFPCFLRLIFLSFSNQHKFPCSYSLSIRPHFSFICFLFPCYLRISLFLYACHSIRHSASLSDSLSSFFAEITLLYSSSPTWPGEE